MRIFKIGFCLIFLQIVEAQVKNFPYLENFDSVVIPALPHNWSTSTNRVSTGDFTTTKSTPHSDSNAVFSTNSKVNQFLISPILDFSNKEVDSLEFWERRSSSHNSGLLIEASTDGGSTFTIGLSDTLQNPGTTSYVIHKLKLPGLLNNQSSVKFRWNVIGNGTGATGTIRFDDIKISARYNYDAAVTYIYFQPNFPITGDSVTVTASIKNVGLQTIGNFTVEFYNDLNNNAQPEASELFSSTIIDQQIIKGDTIQVRSTLKDVVFRDYSIIVKVILPNDQNNFNDTKRSILSIGLPRFSIIINEIMYAPNNPEPEWVEIYNKTDDSINLKNWKISNRNITSKYILSSNSIIFQPKEYCIITKDASLFTAIHSDLPCQIIQVTSMPTYTFNNTGDAIVLFDHRGAVMDSVKYSPTWGGTEGRSLERIEAQGNSNDSTNWGTSPDSSGSTPGFQNYLTPLDNDLQITNITSYQKSIDTLFITIVVRNAGYKIVDSFKCSLYYDINDNLIAEQEELLQTQDVISTILFKDSIKINFTWINPPSGRKRIIGLIEYEEDMRVSDNSLTKEIRNPFHRNSLIINEIMYEPKSGDAEYVELYNPNDTSIDIHEWKLADFKDTSKSSKFIICQTSFTINSGDFLVVAFDSAIYKRFAYLRDSSYKIIIKQGTVSLNNTGDEVVLIDLTGTTIDSVNYLPTWHNPDIEDVTGRSLERINPKLPSNDSRNWSTCANSFGGTPGKQNSLFTLSIPSNATMSVSPNPFSPDEDGFEDFTILSYKLPLTTALIRIRIFDSKGRLVRTLANSEPSSSTGEIVWDGYNDQHQRVRVGIYIILLEALDGSGGNIQTVKGTVVVGAKL